MNEPDTHGETTTTIYASGPSDVAEQDVERRSYDNNAEAFDDKQRQSIDAQTAPNVTTDAELAREAYGEDWNRRRGARVVATTESGDQLFARGSTVVDRAGHVLGRTDDIEAAVARKESLGTDGELGRYGVTAEAQAAELRQANSDGTSAADSRTLDGGLGSAVDGREQDEHDRQATGADERYAAPADGELSTGARPSPPRKATGSKATGK